MKNSRLTPVTVPIRLKSGRVTQGTRLMNLVPKAAAGAPSAGPVAAAPTIHHIQDNFVDGVQVLRRSSIPGVDGTDGRLHSIDDRSSQELSNGARSWHRDGLLHRENGPAQIGADGTERWFTNGVMHPGNGPLVAAKAPKVSQTTMRILKRGEVRELKGKTVDSIIRRVFGQRASFAESKDRNSPEAGLVLYPATGGGSNIVAKVLDYDGEDGSEEREARDYKREYDRY